MRKLLILNIISSLFFIIDADIANVAVNKKADLHSYKFPACQACKLLVSSFQSGYKKTERGKLEGGDADWEEKNRLSYATSEIRYVEILENICSEVEKGRYQCLSLAEENEALFETYWKIQKSIDDLEAWLCVEQSQVCCTELHYGPNCTPCAGFPNNVCNNNGKCKGSGTRKGNGQCSCNVGYEGGGCNKCAPSYFESYKDDNKLLCSQCHQSCEETCTQAGPKGCLACRLGWIRDSESGCIDINECVSNVRACASNQFCVNSEGSYSCITCDKSCAQCDGDGPDMCLKCADGYILKNNICEDSTKQQSERTLNITRYVTYFGLCVATCIVFQRNTAVASFIGLAVGLYISLSEYMLNSGKASPDLKLNMGNTFPDV